MNGRWEWRGSVPFDTQMPLDSDSNYAGRKHTGVDGAVPGREKEDAVARSTEAFNPIHFVFLSPTVSQDSQRCAALALALSFLSFSLFFFAKNKSNRDHSFERDGAAAESFKA